MLRWISGLDVFPQTFPILHPLSQSRHVFYGPGVWVSKFADFPWWCILLSSSLPDNDTHMYWINFRTPGSYSEFEMSETRKSESSPSLTWIPKAWGKEEKGLGIPFLIYWVYPSAREFLKHLRQRAADTMTPSIRVILYCKRPVCNTILVSERWSLNSVERFVWWRSRHQ
jgi:hypothetical protein